MAELVLPIAEVRESFLAAMAELQAEGRRAMEFEAEGVAEFAR